MMNLFIVAVAVVASVLSHGVDGADVLVPWEKSSSAENTTPSIVVDIGDTLVFQRRIYYSDVWEVAQFDGEQCAQICSHGEEVLASVSNDTTVQMNSPGVFYFVSSFTGLMPCGGGMDTFLQCQSGFRLRVEVSARVNTPIATNEPTSQFTPISTPVVTTLPPAQAVEFLFVNSTRPVANQFQERDAIPTFVGETTIQVLWNEEVNFVFPNELPDDMCVFLQIQVDDTTFDRPRAEFLCNQMQDQMRVVPNGFVFEVPEYVFCATNTNFQITLNTTYVRLATNSSATSSPFEAWNFTTEREFLDDTFSASSDFAVEVSVQFDVAAQLSQDDLDTFRNDLARFFCIDADDRLPRDSFSATMPDQYGVSTIKFVIDPAQQEHQREIQKSPVVLASDLGELITDGRAGMFLFFGESVPANAFPKLLNVVAKPTNGSEVMVRFVPGKPLPLWLYAIIFSVYAVLMFVWIVQTLPVFDDLLDWNQLLIMCLSISSFVVLLVAVVSLSQLNPRIVTELLGPRSDRGGWTVPQFAPVSAWTFPDAVQARSGWEFEILTACLVIPVVVNAAILLHEKRKALFFEDCHYFFDDFETGILGKVFWVSIGLLNVENLNWTYRWRRTAGKLTINAEGTNQFRRRFVFCSASSDLFHFLTLICLVYVSRGFYDTAIVVEFVILWLALTFSTSKKILLCLRLILRRPAKYYHAVKGSPLDTHGSQGTVDEEASSGELYLESSTDSSLGDSGSDDIVAGGNESIDLESDHFGRRSSRSSSIFNEK